MRRTACAITWFLGTMSLALLTTGSAISAPLRIDLSQENRTILVPGNGEGTVEIDVFAPDDLPGADRAHLNLCLVLDRSGSMGEARKLEFVKRAAHALIDRLAPDDIISIVAYDHVVEVPFRSQVAEDRGALHRAVDSLYPRGQTFLSGGLEEGFRQARAGRRRGYVNRVLLLSDGLANVGTTDRAALGDLAGEMREKGISVTTMGVGVDFDEELLARVACGGGGTYYYLQDPGSIITALQREFHLASRVAATSVEIVIRLRRGCSFGGFIGLPWTREGDDCVVRLGDLSAGERRSLFARLRVEDQAPGSRELGEVSLRFRDPLEGRLVNAGGKMVSFEVVRDEALHRRSFDEKVQAQRTLVEAAVKAQEAAALVDQGKREEAKAVLGEARSMLAAAPCAPGVAPALREAQEGVLGYSSGIDRLDSMSEPEVREMQKGVKYRSYQAVQQK